MIFKETGGINSFKLVQCHDQICVLEIQSDYTWENGLQGGETEAYEPVNRLLQ